MSFQYVNIPPSNETGINVIILLYCTVTFILIFCNNLCGASLMIHITQLKIAARCVET